MMPEKTERSLIKKQQQAQLGRFSAGFDSDGHHGSTGGANSMPRIITFGSMPSYRDEKMIELKHQQQKQCGMPPPPPPPLSMPPQHQSSQTPNASVQHSLYAKENRKDSATSPVDPSLMDQDDELLLMDDRPTARFIELSPNNLPKLSVKDKLLAAAAAAAAAGSQQQHRWASMLSQTMPGGIDIGGGATTVTTSASTTVTTPLLQDDVTGLHHSRHSLHRQSSQGTGSAASESPLTEVERTLKNFNGYHEDILEALHTVSQQRHHQKSLECIRTGIGSGPGSGSGSGGGGQGSTGGDGIGSGPASLGRQTPVSELTKKAFLDSDYGGKRALASML